MRIFICLLVFLFVFANSAQAVEDPLEVPNNKFGIHIIDENDLEKARSLVNSSGGDWGYVTIVIREDERSFERWQEVFNKMRRMRLIPIVRMATKQVSAGWEKAKTEEINNWLAFLNSLNWVTKNRYIIVGNEPNQAHEWGGEMKPEEYAKYLKDMSFRLKEASDDYFVLPAGFDAAAPNSKTTMSEEKFITEMVKYEPKVFDFVDGWASHSYPDPKKTLENQKGQGTLRTFIWELSLLKSLGVDKKLPVFITETGWKSNADARPEEIGEMYRSAFDEAWSDERIVAITPFILNYGGELFSDFSWLDKDGRPLAFYTRVSEFSKIKGNPVQITDGEIIGSFSLPIVQSGHSVYGLMVVENKGQSIWEGDEFSLAQGELISKPTIEPKERKLVFFKHKTPDYQGLYPITLQLMRRGKVFGKTNQKYIRVVKLWFPFKFLLPI